MRCVLNKESVENLEERLLEESPDVPDHKIAAIVILILGQQQELYENGKVSNEGIQHKDLVEQAREWYYILYGGEEDE